MRDRLAHRFGFRLTEQEKDWLERLGRHYGTAAGDLLRQFIRAQAQQTFGEPAPRKRGADAAKRTTSEH